MAPPNISDISVSSSAREDFLCLVLLPVCCKDQSVKSNLTTNALREVIVTVNCSKAGGAKREYASSFEFKS